MGEEVCNNYLPFLDPWVAKNITAPLLVVHGEKDDLR